MQKSQTKMSRSVKSLFHCDSCGVDIETSGDTVPTECFNCGQNTFTQTGKMEVSVVVTVTQLPFGAKQ